MSGAEKANEIAFNLGTAIAKSLGVESAEAFYEAHPDVLTAVLDVTVHNGLAEDLSKELTAEREARAAFEAETSKTLEALQSEVAPMKLEKTLAPVMKELNLVDSARDDIIARIKAEGIEPEGAVDFVKKLAPTVPHWQKPSVGGPAPHQKVSAGDVIISHNMSYREVVAAQKLAKERGVEPIWTGR